MRFSVIIPLYNKAEYIGRTLASVFSQVCTDYEVIVIDDGSTDDSFLVASHKVANHPECRVIKQDNMGVAITRNRGVEMARGEFVCFLDADDWWEDDFLYEIENLIDSFPDAGMYGTGFYIVKNDCKRVAPIGVEKGFQAGYINYCQTYARTLCMPITSSSVAIPREVFIKSGGFKSQITLGEDFDLWVRIALKHKVALVNKPLANYYQDIPTSRRATRHLHNPQNHMLWNLDYLDEEMEHNDDLKLLINRLRASGLYRYYLSREYHEAALTYLSKIDWSLVSNKSYHIYHSPLWLQRFRFHFFSVAANIKSRILKIRHTS